VRHGKTSSDRLNRNNLAGKNLATKLPSYAATLLAASSWRYATPPGTY
jgi:hypothetical protein